MTIRSHLRQKFVGLVFVLSLGLSETSSAQYLKSRDRAPAPEIQGRDTVAQF